MEKEKRLVLSVSVSVSLSLLLFFFFSASLHLDLSGCVLSRLYIKQNVVKQQMTVTKKNRKSQANFSVFKSWEVLSQGPLRRFGGAVSTHAVEPAGRSQQDVLWMNSRTGP